MVPHQLPNLKVNDNSRVNIKMILLCTFMAASKFRGEGRQLRLREERH